MFTFAYGLGTQELLIVAGLVVLLFGGAKVPELMRGLGQGIREFKKSVDGAEESSASRPTQAPAPAPAKAEASTQTAAPSVDDAQTAER